MPDSDHRFDSSEVTPAARFRRLLATSGDHLGVCRTALELLRERFGAVVVSLGFAPFASGQLCVLTDAGLEDDASPSFVYFPLGTRMLLVDALGSSDVRTLSADDYTAAYPTVSTVIRRPEVVALIAVGFSRNGVIGAVSLGLPTPPDPRLSADLQAMAGAIGDAISVCELRVRGTPRAIDFQRRFLPAEQSTSTELLRRCLYVPARPNESVGADWYDVFDLDDGRIAAVVGDVAGRGPDAVVAMSKAASAVRALLVVDPSPHRALEQLDRVSAISRSIAGASCVVALIDPQSGAVEICHAGHPLALWRTDTGYVAATESSGPLIGFPDGPRCSQRFILDAGATLLLYSNGLVRSSDGTRHATIADLVTDLDEIGAATPASTVAELVDRHLGAATPDDDLLVVALQRGIGAVPVFSRTAEAIASSIPRVRRDLVAWLEANGATHQVPAVRLAVSELMSNVVEHAYRASPMGTMVVEAEIDESAVRVTVIDDGEWSTQIVDTVRGRGLSVVEHVAPSTTIRSSAQGTVARVTIPRSGGPTEGTAAIAVS